MNKAVVIDGFPLEGDGRALDTDQHQGDANPQSRTRGSPGEDESAAGQPRGRDDALGKVPMVLLLLSGGARERGHGRRRTPR